MRSAPAPVCCRLFVWILFLGALPLCASPHRRIPVEEHGDKVYASSQGQCMGNICGLAREQKCFHEPGPDLFPLGQGGWGPHGMKGDVL